MNARNIKQTYARFEKQLEQISRLTEVAKFETKLEKQLRINRAIQDYSFFVQYYFPQYATTPCAQFHIDAAYYIRDNKNAKAVFKWARAHAKSTHMTIFIPLWLKIQNAAVQLSNPPVEGAQLSNPPVTNPNQKQINVMVVVSKSEDKAQTLLADIQAELQANQRYIADFGEQVKDGHWATGEFVTNDDVAFFALGRGQSPRGLRFHEHRPDYIVIDDIDDDELCHNEARVRKLAEWTREALYGTLDGGRGRFIIVGNLISRNSVLQLISEIPVFHISQVNILDNLGNVTWNQKWTRKEVAEMEAVMGYRSFQKEFMNNPITEGAVFNLKDIRFCDILPLRQYRSLVCYTDPSFKDSSKNDFKATILVGLTDKGYYHVIKAFADQTSVSEMINWHYQIKHFCGDNPVQYFMESNFIQDLILDEFRRVGEHNGLHIPIQGDNRKKPDKFARIEALQPLFSRELISFNQHEKNSKGMKNLIEQLISFERGTRAHDDAPDALEGAIFLLNARHKTSNAPFFIFKRKHKYLL